MELERGASPALKSRMLPTGIPRLDDVLGGGIVRGDLVMIVGAPGAGKTTLACQVAFHTAACGHHVIFVSTQSEPASRLVKHLRTFSFWNEATVGQGIFFESIFPKVPTLEQMVDALVRSVRARNAKLIVLDGYNCMRELYPDSAGLQAFVNNLALAMAALDCTTLLTSSQLSGAGHFSAPEFTMCDGLIELAQVEGSERGARSLRPWKVRGANCVVGVHSMRIGGSGVTVYPRFEALPTVDAIPYEPSRLSIGVPALDEMLCGGLPRGSSTVVVGPSAAGKTLLALQFLLAGASTGEKGLLVSFREDVAQHVRKTKAFGLDLEGPLANGLVSTLRFAPVELDADDVLAELSEQLTRHHVTRIVIDSTLELERSLLEHRKHSVFAALLESFRARGITALLTRQTSHRTAALDLALADSPFELMSENVLFLGESSGELPRCPRLCILKMRDSEHERSSLRYALEFGGLRVLPSALIPVHTALESAGEK